MRRLKTVLAWIVAWIVVLGVPGSYFVAAWKLGGWHAVLSLSGAIAVTIAVAFAICWAISTIGEAWTKKQDRPHLSVWSECMPREITTHKVNGCNEAITVTAIDDPRHGDACHQYQIALPAPPDEDYEVVELDFQNGPIAEVGTNGVTHEALLAILIDRLEGFQSGPYNCFENAQALNHLRGALTILHERTKARLKRGVEGTHTV